MIGSSSPKTLLTGGLAAFIMGLFWILWQEEWKAIWLLLQMSRHRSCLVWSLKFQSDFQEVQHCFPICIQHPVAAKAKDRKYTWKLSKPNIWIQNRIMFLHIQLFQGELREKSQIPKLLIKSIQFVLESVLLKAEKPNAKRSFDISDVFSGVWSGQVGALWGVFALRKSRSSITPWSQPDSEHDCKHFRKAEKEKK